METEEEDWSESEIKPVELEVHMLNVPVYSKFCITWSEDDKIAIIADGGVFIFELLPSPFNDNPTLALLKYTIQSSALMSQVNDLTDRSNYLWSLKRQEAFECAFEVTMSCFSEKPDNLGIFPIIKCEFSPLINNKSYIACLTSDGSVEVFDKEFQTLKSIINVSQLWKSFCKNERVFSDYVQTDFNKRRQSGKITGIKWHCEGNRTIFLTSHEHGILCIWELKKNDNLLMSAKSCIRLNQMFCSMALASLESLNYTLLIAGSLSGQVKAYYLDLCMGLIDREFYIWQDADMIVPDFLKITPVNGGFLVLTVKRHVLILSSIASCDSKKMHLFKREILKFPTGICALSEWEQNFLLTLIDHSIYCLNIENINLNHCLKVVHTGRKEKQKNSYHCYGLAMSTNKDIWMMVSSAKTNYDSLKEVTLLTIYTVKEKKFRNLRDSTLPGLIDKIMRFHKEVKLFEIADLLELKRIELVTDESKFKGNYESNGNESLLELKLLLWEAKLKNYCNPNETDSAILNLETIIAKIHARNIALKYEGLDEPESVVEKRSLRMNLDFLSNFENKEKAYGEKCSICGSEAYFESVRISSCANNHKFPRCCISLLPCDQFPYAVCPNCSSVALIEFVSDHENICVYCDNPMIFNVRLNAVN